MFMRAVGVLQGGFGMSTENTEGAEFWIKVINDLKTRGVADT